MPTIAQTIAHGLNGLNRMKHFLHPGQAAVVREFIRTSEERDYFAQQMHDLADIIDAMPKSYESDGQGDEAIVHLHYFYGGSDWWIIEKDAEALDYELEGDPNGHHRAFGFVCLNGDTDCAELGYISLPEMFSGRAVIELDFHWTPKPLRLVKSKLRGEEPDPQPERPASIASATEALGQPAPLNLIPIGFL